MMNPFGLPDEVMDAIAIVKSAIRSQMSGNSRNPFEKPQEVPKPKEVDTAARAAKSAKVAKELYVAYLKEGFSEAQAFELTKGNLYAKL